MDSLRAKTRRDREQVGVKVWFIRRVSLALWFGTGWPGWLGLVHERQMRRSQSPVVNLRLMLECMQRCCRRQYRAALRAIHIVTSRVSARSARAKQNKLLYPVLAPRMGKR